MKKAICLILVLSLCLCMTACGCKHEWTEASCTTPQICALCGETLGEALGHEWKEATCAEAAICSRCGESEGDPLGHEEESAVTKEPLSINEPGEVQTTCTRCGELLETKALHMRPSVDGEHFNFTPEEMLNYLNAIPYGFNLSEETVPAFEALDTDYSDSIKQLQAYGVKSIGGIPISRFNRSPLPFERDTLSTIDKDLTVYRNNTGDDYSDCSVIGFHCNEDGMVDAVIVLGTSYLTLFNDMSVALNTELIAELFEGTTNTESLASMFRTLDFDSAPLSSGDYGSITISYDVLMSSVEIYAAVMSSEPNRLHGCYPFAVITPVGFDIF